MEDDANEAPDPSEQDIEETDYFDTDDSPRPRSKTRQRGVGDFPCEICQIPFAQLGNLRLHKARKHGIAQTYRCPFCRLEFKTIGERREHQKRYTDGNLYTCPEENCNTTFRTTNRVGFKDHLNRHWGRFDYSCEHCGKQYTVKEWFTVHMESHADPNIKPLICHICSKAYKNKQGLSQHMHTHLNPERFKCEVCAKGFPEEYRLREHMLTHTKERNLSCTLCGKTFVRRQELSLHIARIHTGIKKHKCSTCGKAFVESQHLKRHERIHTGDMPYPCSKCGKPHNQTANRNKHEQTCNGTKHLQQQS